MKQLSALDAQFLAIENDRNYGHVGSVAVLDPSTAPGGRFDAETVSALLRARLHLIPPFTWRLAEVPLGLDWPYWVRDEHFDLDYHVRELALPAPGSMAQLIEQTGRIYSRRLDRARPLWELYVVHGLAGGKVAMITKVHHAAVDGMSGGEILSLLYDLTPEPREVDPPGDEPDEAGAVNGLQLVGRAAASLPRAPINVARRVARLLPHVDAAFSLGGAPGTATVSKVVTRVRRTVGAGDAAAVLERPTVRAPRGVFGTLSPHRVFGLASLSLPDVKAVKDHFGVKVNDVVVALVAGAVREHLLQHDRLPERRPLVAQIPVSVRTEEERGTFGNQVSIMFVPVPTDLDDPVGRLRRTAEVLAGAKERHGALPAKALRDLTEFVPPALHARAARRMVELAPRVAQLPFNLIVSNVPGPPIDLYMAGARLEALFPLSIIADGAGLNVTVMSYRDAIDVGITADREQTPDVQAIAEGMREELDRLLAAMG